MLFKLWSMCKYRWIRMWPDHLMNQNVARSIDECRVSFGLHVWCSSRSKSLELKFWFSSKRNPLLCKIFVQYSFLTRISVRLIRFCSVSHFQSWSSSSPSVCLSVSLSFSRFSFLFLTGRPKILQSPESSPLLLSLSKITNGDQWLFCSTDAFLSYFIFIHFIYLVVMSNIWSLKHSIKVSTYLIGGAKNTPTVFPVEE